MKKIISVLIVMTLVFAMTVNAAAYPSYAPVLTPEAENAGTAAEINPMRDPIPNNSGITKSDNYFGQLNTAIVDRTNLDRAHSLTSVPIGTDGQSLEVGDYVSFGTFNGNPLVWRVLDLQDNTAFIYCADSIIYGQYDASSHKYWGYSMMGMTSAYYGSASWRTSDVRNYLNSTERQCSYDTSAAFSYDGLVCGTDADIDMEWQGENVVPNYADLPGFLSDENFTPDELSMILTTRYRTLIPYTDPLCVGQYRAMIDEVVDDDPTKYYNGDYTYIDLDDRVFLLNGLEFYTYKDYISVNRPFWLRDTHSKHYREWFVEYIYEGRDILRIGLNSYNNVIDGDGEADSTNGIRPACNISLDTVEKLRGSGTLEDPYILKDTSRFLPGDLNSSGGEPDVLDGVVMQRILAGLEPEIPAADLNGSGDITVADGVIMQRILAGPE